MITMMSVYGCANYQEYMSVMRFSFINLDKLSRDKVPADFLRDE